MNNLKHCRLCFQQKNDLSSLDADDLRYFKSLTLLEIENLSDLSCKSCRDDLSSAYHIQQRILEADSAFRAFYTTNIDFHVQNEHPVDIEENQPEKCIITPENVNLNPIEGFKCDKCNRTYRTKRLYAIHLVNHKKIKCPHCEVRLGRYNLKEHIKIHTDLPRKCDICQRTLKNARTLTSHIQAVHQTDTNGTNRMQVCHVCGKHLGSVRSLRKHLHNLHKVIDEADSKPEQYECTECGKKFTDRDKYLGHQSNHQKKECGICGLKISRHNYVKHVRMHSDTPRTCHLCGVTCKNSESLRGHLHYTHSAREYKCELCDKVFKKNYDRLLHVKKIHTGEKDHVCDSCGERFVTVSKLKNHVKIHHSESKLYACSFCERRFSYMKALLQHEKQHDSEYTYKCDLCSESFGKKLELRMHKYSEHKVEELRNNQCGDCKRIFTSAYGLKCHSEKCTTLK